jgi:tRNA threonylcarbamoyladenosine biosynthesis protein TsaB
MRVIGIETSGDVTGVAVTDERGVLAEITFRHAMQLSSSLTPRIRDVLKLAGLNARELDGVAVCEGPGSFTGLRIGVAAAKGLAFAAGIPIVAIGALEAVAAEHPAPEGARCWAAAAASKADLFAALFEWVGGRPRLLREPCVIAGAELARRLASRPEELLSAGPLGSHRELLAEVAGGRLLSSVHGATPRPATIAALGRERLLAGGAASLHAVTPRYLLLSAAEARRVAAGATP